MTRSTLNILYNILPLLLSGKVPGEQPTRIVSDTIVLELSRQFSNNIHNTTIETIRGGQFNVPDRPFDFGNESVVVDSMVGLSSCLFLLLKNLFFYF